jgi:hypothetical protein
MSEREMPSQMDFLSCMLGWELLGLLEPFEMIVDTLHTTM